MDKTGLKHMNRKTLSFLFVFLSLMATSFAANWTFDGSGGVYWTSNGYKISAYPATSTQLINHVQYVNFTSTNPTNIVTNFSFVFSKQPLSGDVQLLQNTSHVVAVPHVSRQNATYLVVGVINYTATNASCMIGDNQNAMKFNITYNAGINTTWGIGCFDSYTQSGNNYTLKYSYNLTTFTNETRYSMEWGSILNAFTYANISGKSVYTINDVAFNGNTNYQTKFMYSFPKGTAGKFDIYAHAGSPAMVVAGVAPIYVELDPWFNSTWAYKKEVNLTGFTCPFSYCQYPINLTLNGSATNGSDIRVTDSTETSELPYWREDNEWNNATASGVIWVNASSGTSKIFVYYGATSTVSDSSNGYNVFSIFDDWNNGSVNSARWDSHGVTSITNGVLSVSQTVHTSPFISVATAPINSSMIGRFKFSANTWSYLAFSDAIDVGIGLQTGYDSYSNVNCPAGNTFSILSIFPKDTFGRLRFYRGNPTAYFYLNDFGANRCGGSFSETGERHFILTSWELNPTIYSDWIAAAQMGVNLSTYAVGSQTDNPPPTPSSNVVFISQTPTDLTTTNAVAVGLHISYNITNITSGTPVLQYKVNNSQNDIAYFINGTSFGGWANKTGTNVSSVYNFTLDDNELYPATYNPTDSETDNNLHSAFTMPTQNYFIATELLNVSAKQYNFFEAMINGTSANSYSVFYCNSTFPFNANPATNGNCALIATRAGNAAWNHTHSAYSFHNVFPFAINLTSLSIAGTSVLVTPTSYFIMQGTNGAGTTNAYSVANFTRTGATRTSTNGGTSWSNQTYSLDAHLHQFNGTATLYYSVYANVSGALNQSATRNDTFEFDPLPPTSPTVLTPTAGNKYGIVNISWSPAQNVTPSTIYYNVSLYRSNGTFASTIAANTSTNTSYAWNTAGTAQGEYFVKVTAYDNYSFSTFGESANFTVATFNATALAPTSGSSFVGNQILFQYSQTAQIANAKCNLRIDGVSVNNQTGLAGTYSYLATVANGSHSWVANCSDTEGAGFSFQTANRTFTINFFAFNTQANLTSAPENVLASPQSLFFDINGDLNALYFTDEGATQTVRVKTINGSTVTAQANLTLAPTAQWFVVFRGANNTAILTRQAADTTKGILLTLAGNVLTQANYTMPSANALNLTAFDAYTYANTKQFPTLSLGASSFWIFTTPIATGSVITKWNGTAFTTIDTFANQRSPTWQTIANNSGLTQWLYMIPVDIGGGNVKVQINSYDGTTKTNLTTMLANASGYGLNTSIAGFERYANTTYAYITNTTNQTIIYQIEGNKTYLLNQSVFNPSYFFFIDAKTFVFFATSGGDTYAYSCYFGGTPTCDRIPSSDYGLAVPYEQGFMSSAKRDSYNQDTVVRGLIQSGTVVQLNYNINTYDMKFICYDEQNDARKTFKQRTVTPTTSNALLNYSWGYVLPSASVGAGLKQYFSTCLNGTQRLFLSGLTANFSIDEYSLLSTAGVYYSFTIKDRFGSPLEGVKTSMLRFSNAKQAFVVIEQCLSDFNGGCTFFLEPYSPYKILIEANGFTTQYLDFIPSSVTAINVALDASGTSFSLPNYNYLFGDLTTSLTPLSTLMNNATNITFTATSNASIMEYYGMNVWQTLSNGTRTQVYSNNITSQATGGSVLYNVNSSGRYDVQVFAKIQNFSTYEPFAQAYNFQNKSGLVKARDALTGSNDISGWGLYFLGVVVTMVVVGFVSRYTIDGAGIIGVLVLWGFTLLNPSAAIYTAGSIVITTTIATTITTIATFAALYLRYSATTGG